MALVYPPPVARWLAGLATGLALLTGCREGATSPAAPATVQAPDRRPAPVYYHIKDSALFRDMGGALYLRLPYQYVHEDASHDPPYNFQPCVDLAWGDCRPLRQVLDMPTFRRVPHTTNYWQDKRYVYADPWIPYPAQSFFFRVGRRQSVRFLSDPDFIRCHGQLYYKGVATPNFSLPTGVRVPPDARLPRPR